jgi:hypothetical protein
MSVGSNRACRMVCLRQRSALLTSLTPSPLCRCGFFSGTRVVRLLPESFGHFLALMCAPLNELACANGVPETLSLETAQQVEWRCIGGVVSHLP